MRKLLAVAVFTIVFLLGTIVSAQEVDVGNLHKLALAISKAEGFGVKNTIPTRYHNPGDIRTCRPGLHYPGQVGISHHCYVIFCSDAAGFSALESNLRKIATGKSVYYAPDITINKMARLYATNWHTWAKNVAKNLDVPTDTRLADLLLVFPVDLEK
jgi:hypothetical protein